MLTANAATVVEAVAGTLLAGAMDTVANGVAIDSRNLDPGAVFFALGGERVDGHDYLSEAVLRGARVLVVSRPLDALGEVTAQAAERGVAIIGVGDVLVALQDLAAWHRSRLRCPILGITGSSGKTTTKDFTAAVLGTELRVVCTEGNRNNEIGVPLTIFGAGSTTDVLVVEMGMRGLGQIARLCEIARPTMGLVTNVGTAHVEVVGSESAIVTAKGELVGAVPATGAVFVNGDDPGSSPLADLAKAPVTRYGLSDACDVRATDVMLDGESRASFSLRISGEAPVEVRLPLPGRHNVYNALAAAAVGSRMGLTAETIAAGLAATNVSAMRMQVFTSATGVTVINDAYNANPASMKAAVETLAAMRVPGRRIAVLGDMAELGSLTELAHFDLGELVARSGVDVLVTVGERAVRIAEGARAEGMEPEMVRPCRTPEEASEVLDDIAGQGDAVLVKASRVMGLERVVEGIVVPHV